MFDPSERAAWVARAPQLATGADASEAVAAFRAKRDDALAALGEEPGHDAVRAVILRLLPALGLEDAVRSEAMAAARAALVAFDGDALDHLVAVRRNPSWAVLAARAWAEATEDADAAAVVARVVDHAGRALRRLSPGEASGEGEVLWAVAETASDVGWRDQAAPLLAEAMAAPFEDEENRGRVSLLSILERIESGDEAVGPALKDLLAMDTLDDRTRVHAHWLSALAAHERGADAEAFVHLDAALEAVDEDEDPDVLARLRATHRAWSGDPAEA